MRSIKIGLALLMLVGLFVNVFAQESSQPTQPQGMPPMGPPPEMKQLAFLAGDWDIANKAQEAPGGPVTESKASCKFMPVVEGCAMHQMYEGEFGGMAFKGSGLYSYNRETKKWQCAWLDNMGAMLSYYQGDLTGDKMVVQGEDMYQGQKVITRITMSNITPTKFDWMLESSMDGGKTFMTFMTAVYTKKAPAKKM